MVSIYRHLFPTLWLAWLVYWGLASRNVKTTLREEPAASRLLHILPLIVVAALLWSPRVWPPILNQRYLPVGPWPFWIGAALTLAGMLFSIWARVHLGRNWSGTVTVKQEHELVTSGPYRIVRHPIYTGLLLAIAGSAIAWGDWRGLLALAIAAAALWRKLRLEERWMRETFGASYVAYSERVAALIPFVL